MDASVSTYPTKFVAISGELKDIHFLILTKEIDEFIGVIDGVSDILSDSAVAIRRTKSATHVIENPSEETLKGSDIEIIPHVYQYIKSKIQFISRDFGLLYTNSTPDLSKEQSTLRISNMLDLYQYSSPENKARIESSDPEDLILIMENWKSKADEARGFPAEQMFADIVKIGNNAVKDQIRGFIGDIGEALMTSFNTKYSQYMELAAKVESGEILLRRYMKRRPYPGTSQRSSPTVEVEAQT